MVNAYGDHHALSMRINRPAAAASRRAPYCDAAPPRFRQQTPPAVHVDPAVSLTAGVLGQARLENQASPGGCRRSAAEGFSGGSTFLMCEENTANERLLCNAGSARHSPSWLASERSFALSDPLDRPCCCSAHRHAWDLPFEAALRPDDDAWSRLRPAVRHD